MAFLTTSMASALSRVHVPQRAMSTRTDKTLEHTTATAPSRQTDTAISANSSAKTPAHTPAADLSQFDRMGRVQALVEQYRANGDSERAKAGELFALTLETREGDIITLSISAEYLIEGDNTQGPPVLNTTFSFSVEGDLSDDERAAADALIGRLGEVARHHQKEDWAKIDFLAAVDRDAIAQVGLDVQGNNGNSLKAAYQVMPDGSHHLAVNQNGYEYALSRDTLSAASNFDIQNNIVYQQYAQLITDTTRAYQSGEFAGGVSSAKAVELFLDGLAAIFDITKTTSARDLQVAEAHTANSQDDGAANFQSSEQNSLVSEFLSGLPDFTASFSTPPFTPNESNRAEVSQMTLEIAQQTRYTFNPSSGSQTFTQEHSFASRVSQHFAVGGGDVRFANLAKVSQPGGQTYQYSVVEQAIKLSRQLSIDRDGRLEGYEESKHEDHIESIKTVVNGNIESHTQQDLSMPENNYNFGFAVPKSSDALALHKNQLHNYSTIKILEEAVAVHKIDFYS